MANLDSRLSLLIIDDDSGIVAVLERFFGLDERIRNISVAESGAEALECLAKEGPFDVAICDQRLPDMDGVEILAHMRERYPQAVRILMTGYQDRDAAVEAINRAKIHRYVQKPVELSTLANIVFGLVEEREMRRSDHSDLRSARDMAKAINDYRRKRIGSA